MKKLRDILFIIGSIMVVSSFALRMIHIPYTKLSLIAGGIILLIAFIFTPASDEQGDKTLNKYSYFFYIGGGLVILGVLFKIMHWPFAAILLLSGSVIGLIAFLLPNAKEKDHPDKDEILDDFE
ncbi:hypothetical protein K6119_04595 [Paracrocinitomix mangrovi]|uniref:GldL-related protein n=1 Tax=Paracrocinitomix mangrovi TaxID=2862509 RepID=UPI001C8EF8D6|nr:hypothetical protein [Paracrocinitomix mangrovi]UKN02794.1 hypothetical protein K6119_04595 [Paracrocinitomix mangrovi]